MRRAAPRRALMAALLSSPARRHQGAPGRAAGGAGAARAVPARPNNKPPPRPLPRRAHHPRALPAPALAPSSLPAPPSGPSLADSSTPPGAAADLVDLPRDHPRVAAALAALRCDYSVWALRLPPLAAGSAVQTLGLERLLNWPRFKNVQVVPPGGDDDDDDDESRLLLLSADYAAMDEASVAAAVRDGVAAATNAAAKTRRENPAALALPTTPSDNNDNDNNDSTNVSTPTPTPVVSLKRHTITLPYSFWSVDQVLAHLLPPHLPPVRSFETVGHVAHLNLREEHAPHARLIAGVILDKNASSGTGIRTVVRKTGEVGGPFRTYPLEVLAGEPSTETALVEHGTTLRLDLQDVYWSSRLGTERQRLLGLLGADDVLWDAFSGVGPLAVPAAKRCARVLANDLNPRCVEFLETNARLNKASARLRARCGDARHFLRDAASRSAAMPRAPAGRVHVHMNLPHDVFSFLDAFEAAFPRRLWGDRELPVVHVYSFQWGGDGGDGAAAASAAAEVRRVVGDADVSTHVVRDVAPGKTVVAASFQLPRAYALCD